MATRFRIHGSAGRVFTKCYHGTSLQNLPRLLAKKDDYDLYVTDTFSRAMQYANAQARGEVKITSELLPGAAVVELETTEKIRWRRRPASHLSLDHRETTIREWQIKKITFCRPTYEKTMIKIANEYLNIHDYLAILMDTSKFSICELASGMVPRLIANRSTRLSGSCGGAYNCSTTK